VDTLKRATESISRELRQELRDEDRRQEVARSLLTGNPSIEELRGIVYFVPEEREEASRLLLDRDASLSSLLLVVCCAEGSIASKALGLIQPSSVTHEQRQMVLFHCFPELKDAVTSVLPLQENAQEAIS